MKLLSRIKNHSASIVILSVAMIAFIAASLWLSSTTGAWRMLQVDRILAGGDQVDPEILHQILAQGNPDKAVSAGASLHSHSLVAAALYAESKEESEAARKVLIEGKISAQTALSLEPADAYAWARLAYFRHELDGPSPRVLNALRMSVYTAPSDSDLIFWRLGMTAGSHTYWDDASMDWIYRQILTGWSINRKMLVQTAEAYGFLSLVRMVLASDPEASTRLERIISSSNQ